MTDARSSFARSLPRRKRANRQQANEPTAYDVRITGSMPVSDIMTLLPEAGPLLAEYGLHCFDCACSTIETLDEGCRSHGFVDRDIADLVTDLNELLSEQPERPQTLTITKSAAEALQKILRVETPYYGVSTDAGCVVVTLDEHGAFCMEVQEEAPEGTAVFRHPDILSVRVCVSPLTLRRIGGATIDYREERFKLDLAEDKGTCGCAGGKCGCPTDPPSPLPRERARERVVDEHSSAPSP